MKDVAVYFTQQGVKFCKVWHIMVFFSGTLVWYHTHTYTRKHKYTHTHKHILHSPSKHINVESTLKQHWSSSFINVVSVLIFGWKWKLSRRTFISVFQRWQNNVETTLIELRWFVVDDPTLFQGWY